jgi:hypothetical protein
MAIHAGGARRDIRIPGFFDGVMTVTAINAKLPRVSRMRKGDGLNGLITKRLLKNINPNSGRTIFLKEKITWVLGWT